jgi:hypothetical protein
MPSRPRRRILLWPCLGLLVYGPVLVGALPVRPAAELLGALLAFAVYAFGFSPSLRLKKAALVLVSACFAVTGFDLGARAALYHLLDGRPKQLLAHRWPPLPLVYRFGAGVRFRGETYGDLAAASLRSDWGERRVIDFVTDERGFRNEPGAGDAPLDLVLLGDSYCVGDGTSQESTWGSVLRADYGLHSYNLCMDGAGPWQEYVNLLAEGRRLPAREGATVVWLLFAGNDLDDASHAAREWSRLPWHGPLARLRFSAENFRRRSPLRRVALAGGGAAEGAVERSLPDGRRVLFFAPYARAAARTAEEVRRHPNYEGLRATFGAMRRLAGERRLRVLVALAPSKEEVYGWVLGGGGPWANAREPSGFSTALAELSRREGFAFLDLKPRMVASARRAFEESGELLWWGDDTHWNPAGHRVAAETIYDGLLSPRAKRPAGPSAEP